MKREYEEAFVEVDEILKLMPVEMLMKIPLQFKKIITENKASDYKPNLKEPIEEQQLKYETKAILGLIYRDFLVTPEEREELQKNDAEELRKVELEMQQQYDVQNIFENRKKQVNKQHSTDLVVYKREGIIKKIIKFFKTLFN